MLSCFSKWLKDSIRESRQERKSKALWTSSLLEGKVCVLPIFANQYFSKRWSSTKDDQMNESMNEWMSSKCEVQCTSVLHDGLFLQNGWFWIEVLKGVGAELSPEWLWKEKVSLTDTHLLSNPPPIYQISSCFSVPSIACACVGVSEYCVSVSSTYFVPAGK